MHVTKSTKCNENSRTWMIVSLAFLVENISSLLDLCNSHTLQISLQFNQGTNSIYHSSNSSHRIIKTKQCMQACQRLFYLEKWFLIGYKHFKTPIGHL